MKHKVWYMPTKLSLDAVWGQSNPPSKARLSCKKREYRSRLTSTKSKESTEKLGTMDWEVPSDDALLKDMIIKVVHFAATEYGVAGSIEALVVRWLNLLMLTATISQYQWWQSQLEASYTWSFCWWILGCSLCWSWKFGNYEGLRSCWVWSEY